MKYAYIWIFALFILFINSPAFAYFSEFVSISPASEKNHKEMRPTIKSRGDLITISVPYQDGQKKYWLIVSDKQLPQSKQNFRKMIWDVKVMPLDITLMVPLRNPFKENCGKLQNKEEKLYTQIVLPRTMAMHSYIYYDYPTFVMDGGFYYSIDIPSYLQKMKL